MAQLNGLAQGNWWYAHNETSKDQCDRIDEMLEKLMKASREVPKGKVVGIVLSFPVADSTALYLVSKEQPLTLEHIPYGDAWQIAPAHMRGINRDDVFTQARQAKLLSELESRKRMWP